VRYLVEGSVRRGDGRVRINAQLIDAETGNNIWAGRFDREIERMFAVQDELTLGIITAIQPAVADAESRRTLRRPPESLSAWETYQRGLWHVGKANALDNGQARNLFRRAAELDPTFASPHAMLAYSYRLGFFAGDAHSVRQHMELAETEAQRAIELDPDDPVSQAAMSWVCFDDVSYRAALEQADRAISLVPNDALAWTAKARVLLFSGRPSEARKVIDTVLRLNPRGSVGWIASHALIAAHYLERNYIAAVEEAKALLRAHPTYPPIYLYLAMALGQLGRIDEAGHALRRAVDIEPQQIDYYLRKRPPWIRLEDYEHWLEGLGKAGWEG
jgi:adenylate cyclase